MIAIFHLLYKFRKKNFNQLAKLGQKNTFDPKSRKCFQFDIHIVVFFYLINNIHLCLEQVATFKLFSFKSLEYCTEKSKKYIQTSLAFTITVLCVQYA